MQKRERELKCLEIRYKDKVYRKKVGKGKKEGERK
jgi:hypothetical protein